MHKILLILSLALMGCNFGVFMHNENFLNLVLAGLWAITAFCNYKAIQHS